MQKPRITSKNAHRIDLSDGSFVIVKGSMSWRILRTLIEFEADHEKPENPAVAAEKAFQNIVELLKIAIIGWNFIDEAGEPIPFDKNLIDDMDYQSLTEIMKLVKPLYLPEKKSLPSSTQTSPEDSDATEPKTS